MRDRQNGVRSILFVLAGVPFTITSQSWQFIPPKLVIGIMVALVSLPHESLLLRVVWGMVFGFLLLLVLALHILGHILTSKLVTPPMIEAHITPILIQTLYQNDVSETPGIIHLTRSIGGPLINVFIGVSSMLVWNQAQDQALLFFAISNLVITSLVLLPLAR